MNRTLKPGDVLLGFCNGAFGRYYLNKEVVAVGPNLEWIVARQGGEAGQGELMFADLSDRPYERRVADVAEWAGWIEPGDEL